MQAAQLSPELADAADVLSDQLRVHLQRLAVLLEPHADRIDRKFVSRLRELQFEPKQRVALAPITPGAAARVLASGKSPLKFIEQVEYNGRRLAKLNLPPSAILEALEEYDQLLTPMLKALMPDENANFQWVREQLHFCVILTLNNAYYQVREAETQAFYELFRIELESRNLEELLRRFLESLVHVCHADAGRLYMLSEDGSEWVLKAGAPEPAAFSIAKPAGLIKKLSKPRYLNGERASRAACSMRTGTAGSSAAGRFRWPPTDAPRESCSSVSPSLRMAAARAGVAGRRRRALPDGGRESSA